MKFDQPVSYFTHMLKLISFVQLSCCVALGKAAVNNYWHDSDILIYLPSVTPEA